MRIRFIYRPNTTIAESFLSGNRFVYSFCFACWPFYVCFLCSLRACVLFYVFVFYINNGTKTSNSGSRPPSGLEKRAPEASPLTRRKTYDKGQAAADRAKAQEIKQ